MNLGVRLSHFDDGRSLIRTDYNLHIFKTVIDIDLKIFIYVKD